MSMPDSTPTAAGPQQKRPWWPVVKWTLFAVMLYFVGQRAEDDALPGKYPLHALEIASGRFLWRHRVNRDVPNLQDWKTSTLLPSADGVYYENAQLVAKVAR